LGCALIPTAAEAAFPGQNGRIAFVVQDHGHGEIWSMKPNGSDKRQLTHDTATHPNFSPSFDPSGRRITWDHKNHANDNIWLMHADGSHKRLFVDLSGDFTPTFSPSGNHVAFSSTRGGAARIYVARVVDRIVTGDDLGTPTLRRATHATAPFGESIDDRNPTWTGNWLAFDREDTSGNTQIYLQHPKDRSATKITSGQGINYQPNFSPNAKRIVFVHQDPGARPEIWKMDRHGSHPKPLVKGQGPNISGIHPSFSPQGDKVVFQRVLNHDNDKIYVVGRDGLDAHQITGPGMDSGDPDWGPRP
jgi:Tol biopolymer transport system component